MFDSNVPANCPEKYTLLDFFPQKLYSKKNNGNITLIDRTLAQEGALKNMARTIGIGKQDFEDVITRNNFYIDKTMFIKEWWENDDKVTLITRPRRFGKTLNMSMTEQFFSVEYAGRGELFEGLEIWKEEKYRKRKRNLEPFIGQRIFESASLRRGLGISGCAGL